jgi:hypothetical protein
MELIIKEIAALIDDAESTKASTLREAEQIKIERKAYKNIKELIKELDYGRTKDVCKINSIE